VGSAQTTNKDLEIKKLYSQISEFAKKDKQYSELLVENTSLKEKLKNTRSDINFDL
jgi:hypothetical protein